METRTTAQRVSGWPLALVLSLCAGGAACLPIELQHSHNFGDSTLSKVWPTTKCAAKSE